jgi:hypothetical protein
MPTLLLLFYLLATDPPREVCALWVSTYPNREQIAAACPPGALTPANNLHAEHIATGRHACGHLTADALPGILTACPEAWPLSEWRFVVTSPPTERVVCAVKTPNHPPTAEEITDQCGAVTYQRIEYMGNVQPTAPQAAAHQCPGAPEPSANIATERPLAWLAGRLLWHGVVPAPNCPTLYTRDGHASECALQAILPDVIAWQNQYDVEILTAAERHSVPAPVLKAVLLLESQMWPLWDKRPAGEVGIAQITLAAADRYHAHYTPGWWQLTESQRAAQRAAILAQVTCHHCTLADAAHAERANIALYAAILRAYGCAAGDWHAALVLWNGEPYAKLVLDSVRW